MRRRLLLACPVVIAVAVAVLVMVGDARAGHYVGLGGFVLGGLLLGGNSLRPAARSVDGIDQRTLPK